MKNRVARARNFLCGLGFLALAGCSHPAVRVPSEDPTAFDPELSSEEAELQNSSLIEQGYAHYRRADFPRAIQQLEAAFLVDRHSSEVWAKHILYYCYLSTGQYERARSLAEDIARSFPFRALSYEQVGLAHLWLGQTKTALEQFRRALEFENHSPRIYFYQGLAHAQLHQDEERDRAFEKAEREYRQILELNPKDLIANYELASLYLYSDRDLDQAAMRLTAAKENLRVAFDEELTPDKKLYQRFYLPLLEGIFLSRKGEPKASQKLLFEALANAPSGAKADVAEVYHYAGVNGAALGDLEAANSFTSKAIDLDPKGPYALVPPSRKVKGRTK